MRCARPLQLLRVPGSTRGDARRICASCADDTLAEPCRVRGCFGASDSKRGVGICAGCRLKKKRECTKRWAQQNVEKQRAHNRKYYRKISATLLSNRRATRLLNGDAIRAKEQATRNRRKSIIQASAR